MPYPYLPDIGDDISIVVVPNTDVKVTVGVSNVKFDVVGTLAEVVTDKPIYIIYIQEKIRIIFLKYVGMQLSHSYFSANKL